MKKSSIVKNFSFRFLQKFKILPKNNPKMMIFLKKHSFKQGYFARNELIPYKSSQKKISKYLIIVIYQSNYDDMNYVQLQEKYFYFVHFVVHIL